MSSLQSLTDEATKAKLRKLRVMPSKAKASLYQDNLGGAAMAMQLATDCQVYGVWEALLYVEGYEASGHYRQGAAHRALAMTSWKKAKPATV